MARHLINQRSAARPAGLRRRRAGKDRQGAAMVEFAIIANTMFLSIFTCCEFARLNLIRNTSQNAAYYGARAAMVSGATAQDAITAADTLLDAISAQGYTVTVNDGTPLTSSTEEIIVKVEFDFAANAFFAPLLIPAKKYSTTVKMKSERYDFFYDGST
ncbi:MAG: TadE/TadG family type IV pilus assembly protein [Pirellulaceae bacterium]